MAACRKEIPCLEFTALLVCLTAWLFTDRTSFLLLGNVKQPYMLLAGVIGAFITVTVVKSMADLGPARAAMLIVISQLAVAYVIELFGMFGVEKQPFEWRKLIGLLVSVTGIIVFKW